MLYGCRMAAVGLTISKTSCSSSSLDSSYISYNK